MNKPTKKPTAKPARPLSDAEYAAARQKSREEACANTLRLIDECFARAWIDPDMPETYPDHQ